MTLRKGIALTTTDNPTYNHFQTLTSQLTTSFNHWQASLHPPSTTDKSAYNHFQPLTSQLTTTFNHWQTSLQPLSTTLTIQLTTTFNHWHASLQPLSTTDKPAYKTFQLLFTNQPWWNHKSNPAQPCWNHDWNCTTMVKYMIEPE